MSHTKEPWVSTPAQNDYEWEINAGEWGVAICAAWPGEGTAETNARRIVACVNTCAGSPTEGLEEMQRRGLTFGQLAFLHAELQQKHSELLAAAERTCAWSHCEDDYMPGTWDGSCGALWSFSEDGPAENNIKFCPECGGKVVITTIKAATS